MRKPSAVGRVDLAELVSNTQQFVRDFHLAFGLGAPTNPSVDAFPGLIRLKLLEEELDELRSATDRSDLVEIIDALCDLLYVTYGAAVSLGVDLGPFFAEVHKTNMAKRGSAGGLRTKPVKPRNWSAPRIAAIVDAMYGQAQRTKRQARRGSPSQRRAR